MELKENVYLKDGKTEQEEKIQSGAEMRVDLDRENPKESGSAVLAKFKDVNALSKAYSALEAEFTRRSQRLKELERELENSVKGDGEKSTLNGAFGVEKLKKAQAVKAEEKRKFDRFVSDLEGGIKAEPKNMDGEAREKTAEKIGDNTMENGGLEDLPKRMENVESGLEIAKENDADTVQNATVEMEKETEKAVANLRENDGAANEELYLQATGNEQVRLRIIGEYLQSIGKGAPLMKGGVGATLAPPIKAKSFAEAGSMALRLFKGER